jgi:hypothetical protein
MKIERTAAFEHPTGAVQHALAFDMVVAFALEPGDGDPWMIDWDSDVPPYPVLSGEVGRARATLVERAVRFMRPRAA